jgi:phycoerythrin-associated linker protein
MVSTFVNPFVTFATGSGVRPFDEADPVELRLDASGTNVDIVVRAIYRQILGNAHVMESEQPVILESQLRSGNLSVREFVRLLAQSELYRSRFFDNCHRYRAIELNFKHLLGRAPDSFEEIRAHSDLLDQGGFEAEIDSYINSEEYQQAYGENVVPYYRGYKTHPGQSLLEFTNMLQLLGSASGSDKDTTSGNQSRLMRSLIRNRPYGVERIRDTREILAEVFKIKTPTVSSTPTVSVTEQTLQQQYQEQKALLTTLQAQLADLRPFASIGGAVTQQGQFGGSSDSQAASIAISPAASSLEREIAEQQSQIASLQQQISEARSLAAVGEARLNRWRQRTFF